MDAKRFVSAIVAICVLVTLAGCTSETPDTTIPYENNIKKLVFFSPEDQVIKVGDSTQESYVKAEVKDKHVFSSDNVVFYSENPEIATIEFTKDALGTYLYYKITGISAGETYVYSRAKDGSVMSEKIKVIVESDVDTSTVEASDNTTGKKLTLSDIAYVELSKLQKLFCELPTIQNRDGVNDVIQENNLSVHWFGAYYNPSSCYIGLTSSAVSDRPRDREGEVIDVYFNHDGSIDKFGYATGGSVSSFKYFELTYENGQFYYDSVGYDDGEAAMQLYLANCGEVD